MPCEERSDATHDKGRWRTRMDCRCRCFYGRRGEQSLWKQQQDALFQRCEQPTNLQQDFPCKYHRKKNYIKNPAYFVHFSEKRRYKIFLSLCLVAGKYDYHPANQINKFQNLVVARFELKQYTMFRLLSSFSSWTNTFTIKFQFNLT